MKTIFAFLGALLLAPALAHADTPKVPANLDFKTCNFTITATPDVGLAKDWKTHTGDGKSDYCSLALATTGSLSLQTFGDSGMQMIVAAAPSNADEFFSENGFDKGAKGYTFKGAAFTTIGPQTFKNIRFKEIRNGDDLTLVGQQAELGFISQGPVGPIEVAYIARVTPGFSVAMVIAYEMAVPKKTSDQITSELVKIVDSVKPATP